MGATRIRHGASDPVYRRGVDYLLRTQQEDGTWHVVTRALGFQPYFQSGFPYDHDQSARALSMPQNLHDGNLDGTRDAARLPPRASHPPPFSKHEAAPDYNFLNTSAEFLLPNAMQFATAYSMSIRRPPLAR